jgi:hypothetical protein
MKEGIRVLFVVGLGSIMNAYNSTLFLENGNIMILLVVFVDIMMRGGINLELKLDVGLIGVA